MKIRKFSFQGGTVAYPVGAEKIDLKALSKKVEDAHRERMSIMARSFTGIRVVVDKKLEGLNYYLSVSPKLLEELKKTEAGATDKDAKR